MQHRTEPRFFDEHRDVRILDCEILVHLLHRDISDESRVATDATTPDICHAAASSNFDELVAPADDRTRTGLLGHLACIFARSARGWTGANANLVIMEPSPGLTRFAEVVARDELALDHAALLIGAWDYPARDLEHYRSTLDDIAKRVVPLVERAHGGAERAHAISEYLFGRLGFTGNADDYYDPRNSFLCDVMDRR
ncbi:MAG: transglutaminase family protein, partial [Kofleriaceae bacterium]